MSITLTIALLVGEFLGFYKIIWAIITIMSIMQPYYEDTITKARDRIKGNILAILITGIIINIVDNAIKYTQEGSDIYIKARKEGRYVIISIEDNGAGIPDDMKENVFDTFFTCNNEIADNRRSLGLGLSLCKTIINAHGSELELRDNTPHGCIFEFKLQLSEVHLNE